MIKDAKTDTAERILDITQDLIQTRGFNAFSYQDISDQLGIRKASIHYHFPSKFDLGKAVIERYRHDLKDLMDGAEKENATDYWQVLDAYMEPYFVFAKGGKKVCLCGALSGEYVSLPKKMQTQVSRFFKEHQDWLAKLFEKGRAAGTFHFDENPTPVAKTFFSALQGGLLVERTTGDRKQLYDVVAVLKDTLRGHA